MSLDFHIENQYKRWLFTNHNGNNPIQRMAYYAGYMQAREDFAQEREQMQEAFYKIKYEENNPKILQELKDL